MRLSKAMIAMIAAISLAGCTLDVGGATKVVTTGAAPGITVTQVTVPDKGSITQPVTIPDTMPDTTPATTPDTTPDTTPGTTPDTTPDTTAGTTPDSTPGTTPDTMPDTQTASKPEPTNPIDPADIRTGDAYDTWTVRDWMWNGSEADYYPEEKLVFLTFDDGPSWSVTPKVLDILEANDVPATFFYYTNGDLSDRRETIDRTLRGGHTIAIHTNSHVYSELYPKRRADVDAILRDATRATAKIRSVLDESWTPTVYRFPGGSFSWTGSDGAKRAMKEAKRALAEKGLIYLDWNAMSGDSDPSNKDKSPAGLVKFTIQQAKNARGHVIVVLLHDAEHSKNTPKALQGIIDHFRAEGYAFGRLK